MRSQETFATPSRFAFHLQFTATLGMFLLLFMAIGFAPPAGAQNWTTLPGSATAISANAKGDVWAIGTEPTPGGYKIWRWNHGRWQNIAGGAERIAVDPDGTAWVVTSTGAIFHSNASGQWMPVSGTATDIAVGAKGEIWSLGTRVGEEYGIWHAVIAPGTRNVTGWQPASGSAVRIAVDAEGTPWVVKKAGIIFHLQGGRWVSLGAGRAISVGPDGTVYAVGPTEEAGLGGSTIYRYQNSKWQPLNVAGIELAAGAAGTVYVVQNSSNRILSNSGLPTASYDVAATPTAPAAPVVTPPSGPTKPGATPAASAKPAAAPTAPSTVSGPSSKPAAQAPASGAAAASAPNTVVTPAASGTTTAAAAPTKAATSPSASGTGTASPVTAPTTNATSTGSSSTVSTAPASPASPPATTSTTTASTGTSNTVSTASANPATPAASTGTSAASTGTSNTVATVPANPPTPPDATDLPHRRVPPPRVPLATPPTKAGTTTGSSMSSSSTATRAAVGVPSPAPEGWTALPEGALDIGANAKGNVWRIGTDYNVYRWAAGNWAALPVPVPGGAARISVDPDGTAWVINQVGAIFHSMPNGRFTAENGSATDIGVGANGDVWIIGNDPSGNDYGIYKAIFAAGTRKVSLWQKAPGAAVRIAVGPDGSPWVVNSSGNLFYWLNGNWAQVAINGVKDVSIAPDGVPYLTVSGAVMRMMPNPMNGMSMNQAATAWIPIPFGNLTASNIAAGAAGTVYITRDNSNQNAILSKSGLPALASSTLAANAQPWSAPSASTPPTLSATWTTLPSSALDVGANGNGDLWMIGDNYNIYRWNGNSWTQVPGGAARISVDPDGTAWVVNRDGAIFHSTPDNQWTPQPGSATDIGVGANGDVWAIGTDRSGNDYGIYQAVFTSGTRNISSWQKVDGNGTRIAVGPDGTPWVVDSFGEVYFRQSNQWYTFPFNGFQDVAIASDGTPYLVASDQGGAGGQIFALFDPLPLALASGTSIPATGTSIAAGAPGTIYVTQDRLNHYAILSASGLPFVPLPSASSTQSSSGSLIDAGWDYCWKDTHGRGVGQPLSMNSSDCPAGTVKDPNGLLCYPPCKDGYDMVGPVCWQHGCPQGWRDDGLFCRPTGQGYSRAGNGYVWDITQDWRIPFNSSGQFSRCQSANPQGCEQIPVGGVNLVYPKCKAGYHSGAHDSGYTIYDCVPDANSCPGGKAMVLGSCPKDSYGNGVGQTLGCPAGTEQSGLLCYPTCGPNSHGVGPVCYDDCPSGWVQCGAGCAKDTASCATNTTQQVMSVIQAAAQIVITVATAGAATPGIDAAKIAEQEGVDKLAQEFADDSAHPPTTTDTPKPTTPDTTTTASLKPPPGGMPRLPEVPNPEIPKGGMPPLPETPEAKIPGTPRPTSEPTPKPPSPEPPAPRPTPPAKPSPQPLPDDLAQAFDRIDHMDHAALQDEAESAVYGGTDNYGARVDEGTVPAQIEATRERLLQYRIPLMQRLAARARLLKDDQLAEIFDKRAAEYRANAIKAQQRLDQLAEGGKPGTSSPGGEPAPPSLPPTRPGTATAWDQELAQLRSILKPAPASDPAAAAGDLKGMVDELGTELKQLPADNPEAAELTTEENNLQKLLDGGDKGDAAAGDAGAAARAARARVRLNEIFDDSDSYVQQMRKMFADRTPQGRAQADGEWEKAFDELILGKKSEADFVAALAKADGNASQLNKVLDMLGEMHGNPGGGNPPSASLLDDIAFFRYYLAWYRKRALADVYMEYAQRFGGPSQKALLAQVDAVDADIAVLDQYLDKYGPAPRYSPMDLRQLRNDQWFAENAVEADLAKIEDTSESHIQQDVQWIGADRSGFGRYNLMKAHVDGLGDELGKVQNMSQQEVSDLAAQAKNDFKLSGSAADLTPESQIYKEANDLELDVRQAVGGDADVLAQKLDDLSFYRWYVMKCRKAIIDALAQRAEQLGDANSAAEFKNLSAAIQRWSDQLDAAVSPEGNLFVGNGGFPIDYWNPQNGARQLDIWNIFAQGHPPDQPIPGAPGWMQPGAGGAAPMPAKPGAAIPAAAGPGVAPPGGPMAPSFDDFPAEEMPSLLNMTAAVPVGDANGLMKAVMLTNAALAPQAGSTSTNPSGSTLQQTTQLINTVTNMTPAQLQQAASNASQLVANTNLAQSVSNLPPVTGDTLTTVVTTVTASNTNSATPLAPPSLSSMLPIADVVNKITAASNSTTLSQDAKNMQIAMAALEGAAALDPTGIVGIVSAYTKPLCSLVTQGTSNNGNSGVEAGAQQQSMSGPGPVQPIPQAYTKFINVSAGYISLLSSITNASSPQTALQVQTVMAQYTQARAQLQGVSLTSDQQQKVTAAMQQVNTQVQRVQSLPGGSQLFRKKLPGDD